MNPERLWIRLPNWLGDTLMARPMLHALRADPAGASIRVAGPTGLLELLAPDHLFDSGAAWPADGPARRSLMRDVRAWRPTAAIVLPPSISSALYATMSGARRRIGFAGEGRSLLLTDALPRPPRGDLHLSAEYMKLAQRLRSCLGISSSHPDAAGRIHGMSAPLLPVPVELRAASRAVSAAAGLAETRRALLAPGALYGPTKRWDAERYAELGRRLVARGFAVGVCGTAAERVTCEAVASSIGRGSASLAGRTTLGELAGLCADAALAVCNDSGFAHLSAAVGAPTIVLFGSTSSAWTAPLGPQVRVLQHAPVCSPCFRRECRIGLQCLKAIEVDEVEAACLASAA